MTTACSESLNDYGYLVGEDNLNMNYRTGGLDVGATLRASKWASPDPKTIEQITHLEDTWRQRSEIDQVYKNENLYARLAVSYMFNQNHSVGISASYRRQPWNKPRGYMESTFTQNGTLTEQPAQRLYRFRAGYNAARQRLLHG